MAKEKNVLFQGLALLGLAVGGFTIAQSVYSRVRRKKDEDVIAEVVKEVENFSGVLGNPCGSKLGKACNETISGDSVTGTWQATGAAGSRDCICSGGATALKNKGSKYQRTRKASLINQVYGKRKSGRSVSGSTSGGGTAKINMCWCRRSDGDLYQRPCTEPCGDYEDRLGLVIK